MKRKLIDYDVFERIEKDSLSTAQRELQEAGPVLAKALGVEDVNLHCYGPEDALYEAIDGSFVHANYRLKEGHIEFDNIEQLVINEETEQKKSREILGDIVESLISNDDKRADSLFNEFLELPRTKRVFNEVKKLRVVPIRKDGEIKGYTKARWNVTPKTRESSSKTNARMRSKVKNNKKKPASAKKFLANKRSKVKATIGEWANVASNVMNYIDYRELGPVLSESVAARDNQGNVVAIKIPTVKLRNEAKLLEFDWKTLNTDVVVKRNGAKKIAEDTEFAKAIAELKRHNALADNAGLEESIEKIVSKWPQVIYLTQDELASQIKLALETANVKNFDDQTCVFMAEGILRSAHHAYVDRVAKVLRLAGANVQESVEDAYAAFKVVADKFYPTLDETTRLEMQVFVDLYEALRHVYDLAKEERNEGVLAETVVHLDELVSILRQESEPSLEVAEAAAAWLYDLVESNLEGSDWTISNNVHITVNGDHPDMAKKAKQGYAPSSDFSGNWGDPAPVSDGQSYRGNSDEMRNNSWGNIGGEDSYPNLKNPYVPAPFGDYKMKGEKSIDADSGLLGHWSDSDTWPNLQNPYVPKSVMPKMKSDDLIVDK